MKMIEETINKSIQKIPFQTKNANLEGRLGLTTVISPKNEADFRLDVWKVSSYCWSWGTTYSAKSTQKRAKNDQLSRQLAQITSTL